MPQKRNPRPLETLRIACTIVVGNAQTTWILAHNNITGMNDLKNGARVAGGGQPLPVPVEKIRAALNPEDVVRNRKGIGGTQPDEVKRMIAESRARLEANQNWLNARRQALAKSKADLEKAFQALAGATSN
jgi:argininosuccinate lyase